MNTTYIIGAGGVGSWLVPSMCMLRFPRNAVCIIDGDKLEKKNLNRQLFSEDDIGRNKAVALSERYGCDAIDEYYNHGSISCINPNDVMMVCVDNNPGRNAVLASCDHYGCCAIFGANEVTSAEAFIYRQEWNGTSMDPRVYYPGIAIDQSNDPRSAAIGCTGEAQEKNRQLVTANFMAAALMQHLYVAHLIEGDKMSQDAMQYLPHIIKQNLSKYETKKEKDYHATTAS